MLSGLIGREAQALMAASPAGFLSGRHGQTDERDEQQRTCQLWDKIEVLYISRHIVL